MLRRSPGPPSVAGRQHGARTCERAVRVPVAEAVLQRTVFERDVFYFCRLWLGRPGANLRLRVGLVVEVFEKEEEHDGVHADPPDERSRVVAVDEQQLEGVHHDTHELDHL